MNGGSFGRYRIDGVLGQGGMGRVYRAFDTHLRRPVALKVLAPEEDGSEPRERAARIVAEARAAAAIEHPNVVTIYDAGEESGQPYVAMQLLEGVPLRDYIGRSEPAILVRIGWLVEIALALSAAHRLGIVHRDIKPENVLVCAGGIKVLDFGVAKRAPGAQASRTFSAPHPSMPMSMPGAVIGTPSYMAPEQRRGMPIDARADQYAWGVVAYELLAGSLPADPPRPIGLAAPWVAPEIAWVIDRALAPDRDMRFESIDVLLRALPPYAAPPSVAQPTAPERPAPPRASGPPTLSARPVGPPPVLTVPSAPPPAPAPSGGHLATRRSPGPAPASGGTSAALIVVAVLGALFGVGGLAVGGWYWYGVRTASAVPPVAIPDAAAPVLVVPSPPPSTSAHPSPAPHSSAHDAGPPRAPDASAPQHDVIVFIDVLSPGYPFGSLQGFFSGYKGAFQACLQQPHPKGDLSLSLAVNREGKVWSVSPPPYPAGACMASVVKGASLPPPKDDGVLVMLTIEVQSR